MRKYRIKEVIDCYRNTFFIPQRKILWLFWMDFDVHDPRINISWPVKYSTIEEAEEYISNYCYEEKTTFHEINS